MPILLVGATRVAAIFAGALISPPTDPVPDIIDQRPDDAGKKRCPHQAQQQDPIGTDDSIQSIMVVDVANHGKTSSPGAPVDRPSAAPFTDRQRGTLPLRAVC
jgi:hypothetical protein